VSAEQVFDLIAGRAAGALSAKVANLLRAVLDNGRLAALPEISAQFSGLGQRPSGIVARPSKVPSRSSDEQVPELRRHAREALRPQAQLPRWLSTPALIGGIRVVVGDEVLDTSVKARLEQMKLALTGSPGAADQPEHVQGEHHEPESRRNFRADQEPHRGPCRPATSRTRARWCPSPTASCVCTACRT
jgi:F-type H+-transporting ATPase subunit delta